jgi:hypothetical protein
LPFTNTTHTGILLIAVSTIHTEAKKTHYQSVMSSLQDLLLQLQESIAGLIAASSPQAMDDLCPLQPVE